MPKPFFRYIVVDRSDGTFFGLIIAESPLELFAQKEHGTGITSSSSSAEFAASLSSSAEDRLAGIQGFVTDSIPVGTDRLTALTKMDRERRSFIPVTDNGQFAGVVDRDLLVANVLLDIANNLGVDDQTAAK